MGQVWQATDTQLNRQVALKILPDAFASDPDRLARFTREAQILASLNHPNIAAIYGIEEAEGTRALVLELVEGPTLADRISKGPIPLDEALPIAKQIAEALEAAHEAGVIHRDLKPANIKVREDGTVKVLDFGLAKALDPNPQGDPSQSPRLTAAATQMGMVIGTAAYMAPEQASGKTVDKRADVWAFGVVLYEMLTGTRPFVGDDVSKTLAHVIAIDPDWSALPKNVPPVFGTFLRGCLEKNPKKRIRDIGDVSLAMEGAFETTVSAPSDPGVVPTLQVWQRPLAALGIVVVAVLLASLAVWSLTRPGPLPAAPVVRFSVPLGAEQAFTRTGRHLVALSPDGTQLVYQADQQLYLRRLDQLQATAIPGTREGNGRSPFISPDGEWVGFWAGGQLKKVAMSGGAAVTLGDVANPWGASWGADDMILFGQGPDGIWRAPGTGGTPEVVIPVEDGESAHGPQMLPGGEWVLFTLRPQGVGSWDAAQIVVQSLVTDARMVLLEGGRDARYVETGHLVYALNGVVFAVAFDRDARQVLGGPVPRVEGVRDAPTQTGAVHFSVARNGSLVYVPGSAGGSAVVSLVWVGRDGDEERIPAPPRAYDRPRVSPDGTRVAVDITDGDSTDVWIWDLVGETLTQLTFDEENDCCPLWTPDSARVVFASDREGGGVFWQAADGTGQVERLKDGMALPYAWAADGRLIFEQGPEDIGMLTMEGERTEEMLLNAEFAEAAPALSPDGRWLAYFSLETGRPLIYVQPFPNVDDGQWNVSLGFGVDPVWSPDGRELFYRSESDLMVAQIETEPTFSSRTPGPLFSLSGYATPTGPGIGRRFDVALDGDHFIFRTPGTAEQTSDDDPFNGLIFVENWFEELKARVPVP